MSDVPEIPEATTPFERRVAVSIAILAAVLAFVSMRGDNAKTDSGLKTTEAANQWALFQAKAIREHTLNVEINILNALNPSALNVDIADKTKASAKEDINRYNIGMTTGAAVTNPPPDETYRSTVLKLYAKYLLDKASGIQVDLVHQRVGYDQWAWGNGGVPFAYTDGSTVSVQPVQNVTFVGVRYSYKFK